MSHTNIEIWILERERESILEQKIVNQKDLKIIMKYCFKISYSLFLILLTSLYSKIVNRSTIELQLLYKLYLVFLPFLI